ncbi:phage virion morphogenesis protein [uncultured Cardiobacterium sp.]|uniref:phage virion morphogenesis protein n=1 Tax=uncultured Cardiobacterium sp. TaxID=417619 RepID=UPI00262AB20F|nr:phage virion morphogenesis protein [uncultured Cardiobacterium sp.]
MQFVVFTVGMDTALRKLKQLAERGEDITPVLDELGEDEVTRVMLRFENSEAPDGSIWEDLKVRAGKPLMDTGRLYQSVVAHVANDSLQVGTNVSYAPYHQFGTERIPARPFLGVSDDLLASLQEITLAYFNI